MKLATAGTVVALCLVAGKGLSEAGPWATGKGHSYFNLSFEALETTRLATLDGNIQTIPEFRLRQFGFYGAFGLSERLTVIVDRLGVRRSEIEDFDAASGIEDTRAGVQWQLGRKADWELAARGIVQVPTGDENKGLTVLPTGSGVWEGEVRFGAGRSWRQGRLYGYGEPDINSEAGLCETRFNTSHKSAIGCTRDGCSALPCVAFSLIEVSLAMTPWDRLRVSATASPTPSTGRW